MNEEREDTKYREMVSTFTLIKRIVYSLVFLVLFLSVAFNLYLVFQNKRLNTALDFYTGRVQEMAMRYQVEQNLFRDLLNYAKNKPDLQKLLKKYNITPETVFGGSEKK